MQDAKQKIWAVLRFFFPKRILPLHLLPQPTHHPLHPETIRIWFPPSLSSRSFDEYEARWIMDVLNEGHRVKAVPIEQEADWEVRLETQRHIDRLTTHVGVSATFAHVTPKVTLISLDDWTQNPRGAFLGLPQWRRYLIHYEMARAFNLQSTAFRSIKDKCFNNYMMRGAESDWLHKNDKNYIEEVVKAPYR